MRSKYLRVLAIQITVAVAIVAAMVVGPKDPDGKPSLGLLTVACVAGWGVTLAFWRCPSCRSMLGKALYHRNCPSCGVSFEND